MDTVEKRVQLDVDTCKAVIELTNLSPIGKILLELVFVEDRHDLREDCFSLVLGLCSAALFRTAKLAKF